MIDQALCTVLLPDISHCTRNRATLVMKIVSGYIDCWMCNVLLAEIHRLLTHMKIDDVMMCSQCMSTSMAAFLSFRISSSGRKRVTLLELCIQFTGCTMCYVCSHLFADSVTCDYGCRAACQALAQHFFCTENCLPRLFTL